MTRTDLERAAIQAWKTYCTVDRFAMDNHDIPFVEALNAMFEGKDPGDSDAVRQAKAILRMANTDSIPSSVPIYRGTDGSEYFPGQFEDWRCKLAEGEKVTVSFPTSSFTYCAEAWSGSRFLYVVDPAVMVFDIGQFGNSEEMETITGGLM
ncbi:MAG: hypothetical protein ACREP9_15775, partial [Candidatus Dormibacteraceae bacterium]